MQLFAEYRRFKGRLYFRGIDPFSPKLRIVALSELEIYVTH